MSVTLLQVVAAAQSRQASLVGETAGYLVLGVADQLVGGPRRVEAGQVILESGGAIRVAATQPLEGAGCEAELRQLLSDLLCFSRTVTPALMRCSARAARGRIDDLVRELEAALIPANRAAGRRALARLHRETLRAVEVGGLPEIPLSSRPEGRGAAPKEAQASVDPPVPAPQSGVEVPRVSASEPSVAPVVDVPSIPDVEAGEAGLLLERDEATDPVPAAWESTAFWMEPGLQEHTVPLPVADSGTKAAAAGEDPEIEIEIVVDEAEFEEDAASWATPVLAEPPVEKTAALLLGTPVMPCAIEIREACDVEAASPIAPAAALEDEIPSRQAEPFMKEPDASLHVVAEGQRFDWVDLEPALEADAVAEQEVVPEPTESVSAEPIGEMGLPVAVRQESAPAGAEPVVRAEPAVAVEEENSSVEAPVAAEGELFESPALGIVDAELAEAQSARAALVSEEVGAIAVEPVEWVPVSPPVETRTPAPAVEDPWEDDPVAISESRPTTPKSPDQATGRFASAPPVFAPRRSDVDDLLRQFASGQSDDEICSGLSCIAEEFSPAAPPVRSKRWRDSRLRGEPEHPVPPARVAGASKS